MTAPELFANAYATTLNGAIDNATTTVVVNDPAPASLSAPGQFRILIDQEYLLVVSVGGPSNTTWTVLRGQEGSTAAGHSSGAAVTQVLTAGVLASVAITSSPQTFTAPQLFAGPPQGSQSPVRITTGGSAPPPGVQIDTGPGSGIIVSSGAAYPNDWSSQNIGPIDAVDIWIRSTGDGVCVYHMGGQPPGYSGGLGGCAAFNCCIPYYVDQNGNGNGRTGSVINNRTGQSGLFIQSQATQNTSSAIFVDNFANAPAVYIRNQYTGFPAAGNVHGFEIGDWGTANSLFVNRYTAPSGAGAMISLLNNVPGNTMKAIRVQNRTGARAFDLDTDGVCAFGLPVNVTQMSGTQVEIAHGVAGGDPLAYPIQGARNLFLANSHGGGSAKDLCQIEFGGYWFTSSKIVSRIDTPLRDSTLMFIVSSNGKFVNRLQLDSKGVGFFGVAAVPQPTAAGTTQGFSAGSGGRVQVDATFTGNTGGTAYTIGDVVSALKALGLLAQ